jgi:hypothetical protein
MTTSDAPHWDVAAYALGVLDHRDAARFEDHLADCASCAVELESLLPVTALLADVDASSFVGVEQSQRDGRMFDEMINVVSFDRSRAQARRLLAVAAGTIVMVMAVGLALFAGAQFGASADVQAGASPSASASGPNTGLGGPTDGSTGEKFSSTDATTGVKADLVLESMGWGTQVSLQLAKVQGPLVCQLVAVGPNISGEVVSTWKVPPNGYGTAKNPEPLLLQGATSVSRKDISRIEIQSVGVSGDNKVLVTVPV